MTQNPWTNTKDLEVPPVEGAYKSDKGWELPLAGTDPSKGLTEVIHSIANAGDDFTDDTVGKIVFITEPTDGWYVDGDDIDFVVKFNEQVTVNTNSGTPRLTLTLATGGTKYAEYASGTGTNELTFTYTVEDALLDADGIALSDNIDLNFGTIEDTSDNSTTDVTFTAADLVTLTGVTVDSLDRAVDSVAAPVAGDIATDEDFTLTVTFNGAVLVDTTDGTPSIPVFENDGITAIGDAEYVSGSGTTDLVFTYTVQAGDNEAISVKYGADIALNSGSITDLAGNGVNVTSTFTQASATGVTFNNP